MTLDEWNRIMMVRWREQLERIKHPETYPNGIVCPKCGAMLYDAQKIWRGPPDHMKVLCTNVECAFKGRRVMELSDVRLPLTP